MKVLNWSMLKNPLNYIIILLMLVIAGVAGHLLLSLMGWEPQTQNSSTESSAVRNFRTVSSSSAVSGS
jgi:hypothetical protein